MKLQRMLD